MRKARRLNTLNPLEVSAAADVQARFVARGEAADISVVVVNYNSAHLLHRCIGSLRRASAGLNVQLVVVDNASRDGSAEFITREFPDACLLANSVNSGFGRANNQALAACSAAQLLLLNADTFVRPDTLRLSLAHLASNPRCGVLGVRLTDEAGHGGFSGRRFPSPWDSFRLSTGLFGGAPPTDTAPVSGSAALGCDWIVGCYYMVRREVIEAVGLFDPRYFLYMEEVDHCRAVKAAGWRVECLMTTSVVHVGGGSAESEGELSGGRQIAALQIESSLLYYRKHAGVGGLIASVGLSLLAEAVAVAKGVIKRSPLSLQRMRLRQAAMTVRLLLATHGGSRPTR